MAEISNKTKRTIRRNLPVNTTYQIVKSYYTGGILQGSGECCENCNIPIANVAIVQDSQGNNFRVGMDCAGTLSGIKDTPEYQENQNNFNEAKSVRAKINKALKEEGTILVVQNFSNGKIDMEVKAQGIMPRASVMLDKDFFFTYLTDFVPHIKNPEKNNFKPIASINDLSGYNFDNLNAEEGFTPVTLSLHGFDIVINHTSETAPAGNINYSFTIQVFENGVELKNDTFYMNRKIKPFIVYYINRILFECFIPETQKN